MIKSSGDHHQMPAYSVGGSSAMTGTRISNNQRRGSDRAIPAESDVKTSQGQGRNMSGIFSQLQIDKGVGESN
jgi:hypothetical protein